MTKQFTTGLREKHQLPYGVGHVAIIADHLGSGEPIYSIEIYDRRTQNVERVRCYSKLRQAQRHLMDIHAGASFMLHAQHRPDPQAEDEAPGPVLGRAFDAEITDAIRGKFAQDDEAMGIAQPTDAQAEIAAKVNVAHMLKNIERDDEAKARAQGWVTEREKHGPTSVGTGVVHPEGWWASSWAKALQHPLKPITD